MDPMEIYVAPDTTASGRRERERLFEKARHDEAQALYHARQVGIQKANLDIAKKMKSSGLSFEQISFCTGLSLPEIEAL